MERTNKTVESEIVKNMEIANSWTSHADEWTMPLDNFKRIMSGLKALSDRQSTAALKVLTAAQDYVNESEGARGASYKTKWALSEALYVYSRIIGDTDLTHAIEAFEQNGGSLMFKHTDAAYDGEVVTLTLKGLLAYVNQDHSSGWTDYTAEDWQEGMKEWTDLEIVKW